MKEKWEYSKDYSNYGNPEYDPETYAGHIKGRDSNMVLCPMINDQVDGEANAKEIVALHNAAIEIGPPMEVAKHIGAVVEAAGIVVAQQGSYMENIARLGMALSQLEEK